MYYQFVVLPIFGMNPHCFVDSGNNGHQHSIPREDFCMISMALFVPRNISCPAPWGDAWHSAYSSSAWAGTHYRPRSDHDTLHV